jgi:hypothetical protein
MDTLAYGNHFTKYTYIKTSYCILQIYSSFNGQQTSVKVGKKPETLMKIHEALLLFYVFTTDAFFILIEVFGTRITNFLFLSSLSTILSNFNKYFHY